MSSVKIQGNASGTGILTIAAPNTNTDRTLTLPDEAGTLVTDANGLSYEEGTYTPVLRQSTTNPSSVVYTSQIGSYIKIGKQVTVFIDITWTSRTAGSGVALISLPFIVGTYYSPAVFRNYTGITVAANNLATGYANPATTDFIVQQCNITTGNEANISSWNASGRMNLQITYFTA